MKFLILGCNGMAGHMISLYLKEQGHDVLGFALTKSTLVNSVAGDATNAVFMKELVGVNKFDSIINCIGVLNQFAESDHATATYLNAYFPHQLAKFTQGTDTQVIHMSTDCVFTGKRGQYTEEDLRDGTTFYDRSKALGELDDDENITLRNSIVGPDINQNGIGLLNWFMQQQGEVNGFTGAMWTHIIRHQNLPVNQLSHWQVLTAREQIFQQKHLRIWRLNPYQVLKISDKLSYHPV